jgi:hypothetical protein
MRTTRMITKEVEATVAVFCNGCGSNCALPVGGCPGQPIQWVPDVGFVHLTPEEAVARDLDEGVVNAYGLVEASVSGGCDSVALRDRSTYTFSLCEPCLGLLFATFKHPPAVVEW